MSPLEKPGLFRESKTEGLSPGLMVSSIDCPVAHTPLSEPGREMPEKIHLEKKRRKFTPSAPESHFRDKNSISRRFVSSEEGFNHTPPECDTPRIIFIYRNRGVELVSEI